MHQSISALLDPLLLTARPRDERGDVPGWVMVTLMTAIVVAALTPFVSDELRALLARAFDGLAATTGLPLVARFATGISVAIERGTPLADVLHAQAADVREAGRRLLIETAARKEIAMMAPVVFFVLPVTILFAFYPGVLGLRLTTP